MNKVEITRDKLKSVIKTKFWFLWVIPLLLFVSFTNGIETGLYLSGIIISGISLGIIIPVIIGTLIKKDELKSMYGEIIIFVISTTLLWIYIPDKKLIAFIIPFNIALIIIGLLNLRK